MHERSASLQSACDRATAAANRGDLDAALRHYQYAQRLEPSAGEVTLSIAAVRLAMLDPRAADAFAQIAARDDVQEAWLGLAAAWHHMGEHELAARDLHTLLSRHGHVRGTDNIQRHDAITSAHGDAGWCALSADGRLRVTLLNSAADMNRLVVLLDGTPLAVRLRPTHATGTGCGRSACFPKAGATPSTSRVRLDGQRTCSAARCRHRSSARLRASSRRLPAACPVGPGFRMIRIAHPSSRCGMPGGRTLHTVAIDPAFDVPHAKPLARPEVLDVPAADLRALVAPIAVLDAGGRHLYGSPLDPLVDRRSAAGAAELARRLFPASARRSGGGDRSSPARGAGRYRGRAAIRRGALLGRRRRCRHPGLSRP